MDVIRIEDGTGGNLTWMLPSSISERIQNFTPIEKKILLDKLTIMTSKYINFMVGCLSAGELGLQAQNLYEQHVNQIAGQMVTALEELRRRGGA